MTHPTQDLFAVCAVGTAGVLLGAVGLLLGGRGGPGRTLVSAGGFAGLGAAAWAMGLPAFAWLPPAALAVVWAVFAVCRTPLPERAAAWLGWPRTQAALLAAASAALLLWQSHRIDGDLQTELDITQLALEVGSAVPDLEQTGVLRTDAGTAVPLFAALPDGEGSPAFDGNAYLRRRQLERKLIETGAIDPSYNCHGWVFAGSRGWVRGRAIPDILADNGYRRVARPAVGDLAIYTDVRGEVTHTALVRHIGADGAVLLESKWGRLGRYLHTDSEHIYNHHRRTWYRTARGGHLLRPSGPFPKTTPASPARV